MNTEEDVKKFTEELAALGVILEKMDDVEGDFALGIEVDLDTDVDYSHLVNQDMVMKKLTKRKDFFYITIKDYDTTKKRLTLMIGTPVSEDVFDYYHGALKMLPRVTGTNFPDLCWYHAEGTTELTKEEVMTEFREDAVMGDLNWYLPSRMVDNFIEIMHTLNQSFLEGLMQDTICYGPILMTSKK